MKKINRGDISALGRVVKIIENVKGLKNKFKIWKFFVKNVNSKSFVSASVKHLIWQYLHTRIIELLRKKMELYKICSFPISPSKIQYAYFRNGDLLYLSVTGIPPDKIKCKSNVKVVDNIKYTIVKYPERILKAVIYVDKQKTYINIDNKHLFGPYRIGDVDYVYFDSNYENYAFVHSNGRWLIFNNNEIRLEYSCSFPIHIFKDRVDLLCNSRKYKKSQFLYFNLKKKSVLCDKDSIFYLYKYIAAYRDERILYICRNKNLMSVFLGNQLVKRYISRRPTVGYTYNLSDVEIESKYVSYLVIRKDINGKFVRKRVIYDTISMQARLIESDCKMVFLGNDYFYCRWKNSYVLVIYKNDNRLTELKLNDNYKPNSRMEVAAYYRGELALDRISDYAFYIFFYDFKKGTTTYFIFFTDGRFNIVKRGYNHVLYHLQKKTDIFIVNGFDSHNRKQCFIFNNKEVIKRRGYHCYFYDINFKSYLLTKYIKKKNKTVIYIGKYKKSVEVDGSMGEREYSYLYITKKKYILLLLFKEAGPILFVPIINSKTISIPFSDNFIFPVLYKVAFYYDSSYMPAIHYTNLYLLSEFPLSVVFDIKKIRSFCMYQKRLCRVE